MERIIKIGIDKRKESQIKNDLGGFTGTEQYYKHLSGFVYTDGAREVGVLCEAYWLIDEILFASGKTKEEFQVWTLKVTEDNTGTLIMDDGNNNEIYKKEIPYTDFPMVEIKLFFQGGVLFLPSEY